MMREVEDYDAKLTLFELLEAAKQGETVVITHGGQPVAHLCPAPIPSPSLKSQRSSSGEKEKASGESDGKSPEPWETVSDSLRDILDWRRYGRR
ncbi:MAG: hypothetical protein OXL37_07330 [Chloroflexota bacterium]|nr:hypothetical protein [Chloroflexota bacterium]MDE2959010.1 hypothetical protein [Chloroflexota bacterium]